MFVRCGDIMVSRQNTIISKIICFITRSEWSHTSIYLEDDIIISSVPLKGVCFGKVTDGKVRKYYRIKDIDNEKSKLIANYAVSKLGKPYDFIQAIVLGCRIIFDKVLKRGKDYSPDKFICSELVAEACASQGVFFGKYVDNVLPSVIANSELVIEVKGP